MSNTIPYTEHGHPTSGPTTNRPGNCQVGFRYFDTTIGQTVTFDGTNWVQSTRFPVRTVAVGGTAQANANAVSEGFNLVTGADGTAAVVLPTPQAGMVVVLKNNVAAVLKVFPASGCTINALSANSVFNQPASTSSMLVAFNSTAWFSLPLLPS